jgi:hypothetical protein
MRTEINSLGVCVGVALTSGVAVAVSDGGVLVRVMVEVAVPGGEVFVRATVAVAVAVDGPVVSVA